MSKNKSTKHGFFCSPCDEREADFALNRKPGHVSMSKLFWSAANKRFKRQRYVTFGLEHVEMNYAIASLGREITLSKEKPGRTEIRLVVTEDGDPCDFIIQRFDVTKDGYEKTGVSLNAADVDRLLAAILVHRHYKNSRYRDREQGDRLTLDDLVLRLEPIALQKALEEVENSSTKNNGT